MDEENLQQNSNAKTSKLLGVFSLVFVVVYIIASIVGKRLPELFYKLIPAISSGLGFSGVIIGLKHDIANDENTPSNYLGIIISSIGVFAGLFII